METKATPTCRTCGHNHYNFQECPTPEPQGHMRAAVVIRQPRDERDWKTRARTVQIVQGDVVSIRRKRTHGVSGRVTDSEGKPVSQAPLVKYKPNLTYPKGVN
jgi:hypothetical protein